MQTISMPQSHVGYTREHSQKEENGYKNIHSILLLQLLTCFLPFSKHFLKALLHAVVLPFGGVV